jgi:hypothetical protein
MKRFEESIGLMHGNGPGSASLQQHTSAVRMDRAYAWTYNQLIFAIADEIAVRKACA